MRPDPKLAYACMATMPSRLDVLPTALDSLERQMDAILVYLNGFDEIPECCLRPKVVPLWGLGLAGDLGCSGKLYVAARFVKDVFPPATTLFIVDDDIEYPPDYREVMERELATWGGVVCVHGAKFVRSKIRSYLEDRQVFSFEANVDNYIRCHTPGAGTMAFELGAVELRVPEDFPEPNMIDLQFGIACERQGVPRTVIPHSKEWLRNLHPSGFTISEWYRSHRDDDRTRLAQSIRWA